MFKTNAKELFEEHSDLVSKNNMTIHDFETEQTKLLKNTLIRDAWIEYLAGYPHQAAYFRNAGNFKNQTSMVNVKNFCSPTTIYKLFVYKSFNLLRSSRRSDLITH